MENYVNIEKKNDTSQAGAALVTVILISFLLLTASVAMLTAIGAHSRNTTDVLSETKAYYAAESGLQATINVLRGNLDTTPSDTSDDVTYLKAIKAADSNYSGDPTAHARLSRWLTYGYPTTGTPNRVVIGQDPSTYTPGSGAAYSIEIIDPDNSAAGTTFVTSGAVAANPAAIPTPSPGTLVASRTYPAAADPTVNYTVVSFVPSTEPPVSHPDTAPYPSLGHLRVQKVGTGGPITTTRIRVEYHMTAPRDVSLALWGTIYPDTADSNRAKLKFDTYSYRIVGGDVDLCSTNACTDAGIRPTVFPAIEPALPNSILDTQLFAKILPIEPYRLKIISTGYGPNGAVKKLEAVVQRDLSNGLSNGAGTTMLGPACTPGAPPLNHCFEPGTSNNVGYSGGDCDLGCVPSFGFNNPANYQVAAGSPLVPSGQMDPPPAMLSTDIPEWQRTPQNLEQYVSAARLAAQHDNRYFVNPNGNLSDPGDWDTGLGITFCEGNCSVGGQGGGVLVVTGKLTNLGGFSFKGLILVVGEEGWDRSGGGGGTIIGNVVIAPYYLRLPSYSPTNLSATFLPPRYYISGGGEADIIYADVSAQFDSIGGVSDLVAGVAEK